jgi:predicted transcriptional regulator
MSRTKDRDTTPSGLTRFTFFIPVEDLNRLKEIGQVDDREPSWLIRKAVREFVERSKKK